MTALRLPRGVVHTDPACWHLRAKAPCETLLAPTPAQVCRDCRKRAERRRDAARAAHEAAGLGQLLALAQARPSSADGTYCVLGLLWDGGWWHFGEIHARYPEGEIEGGAMAHTPEDAVCAWLLAVASALPPPPEPVP